MDSNIKRNIYIKIDISSEIGIVESIFTINENRLSQKL